jgi:Ca2+-binding RTX toxin-like protein
MEMRTYHLGDNYLLLGSNLGETMNSGATDDVILGLGGNDILNGNDGDDVLSGGNGDDILRGGNGVNILAGDNGSDTFVFRGMEGSRDEIADFTPGEDVIKLVNTGVNSWAELQPLLTDVDDHVTMLLDGNSIIHIDDVKIADLHKSGFVFA